MAKDDIPKTEKPEAQKPAPEGENKPDDETGDKQGAINSNISAIGDTLAQSMPDVQEHAIAEEASKLSDAQAAWADITDRQGSSFHPDTHKTNKAGEPTLTNQGNCIRRPKPKEGGAKQTRSVIGNQPGQPGANETSPEQSAKIQARASGAMAANLLLTIGIVAGGEEWKPQKDVATGMDEKAMLEGAFSDYFEATGKTDLPPSMTLIVAIGAYSLPRFTMPKTQTRIGKLKSWVVKKLADRKLKKHGLKTAHTETTMDA
jgi:hypothetical protein